MRASSTITLVDAHASLHTEDIALWEYWLPSPVEFESFELPILCSSCLCSSGARGWLETAVRPTGQGCRTRGAVLRTTTTATGGFAAQPHAAAR